MPKTLQPLSQALLRKAFRGSYADVARKFNLTEMAAREAVELLLREVQSTATQSLPPLATEDLANPATPQHAPASHACPAKAGMACRLGDAHPAANSPGAHLVLQVPRDWTGSVRFDPS